jgi:peroxiredoxin
MLSLVAALALAAQPAVGDTVADFTVKDIDGVELQLSELVKKGNVVIAFFPKAFTPG